MKVRSIAVAIAGLLVASAFWIFAQQSLLNSSSQSQTATIDGTFLQKPGGPYEPRDPRWKEWDENMKRDPGFQWRMPIEFYGKVVDERERPVQGAKFDIVGTDASPSGNFYRTLYSDANGTVSLKGLRGKTFGVLVSKDGYYRPQTNRRSFEYAAFSDPSYYQPDPNNPVIFHLRKIGEPAPLIVSDGEFIMTFGMPWAVPLPQEIAGASPVEITVFQNDIRPKDWNARISVSGGGVQSTVEEFPFQAPLDGYQPSINANHDSPHAPGWPDDEGGFYYLKTRQGYGILILLQMRGKRTIHYSLLLNSKGGRDLEPAKYVPVF
jgi:hypothetical protein